LSALASSRRYWSLGFGVAYLAGAVLAGFNLDMVWDVFAAEGVSGQAHHLASILTTVFPHVVAIAGLALLIAGQKLSRLAFVGIAIFPVIYTIACLAVRSSY
jgi:hypothetical protein